jgi:hypothetical protein
MRIHFLLAAGVLAGAVLPAGAQSMKPGLWEINNKMSGGQMDQAMAEMQQQMAQMPPEQRKQMEAMMAQRGVKMMPGGPGGGMAIRMCMTREMVERNEVPVQDGCTTSRQQRTGNTLKIAFSCTNPPASGEGDFRFSGDSYTSHMTIRTTVQGKQEAMVMDGSGKWLGADCGSVKPIAPPRK